MIAYIGGFLTIQINAVSKSINEVATVNPIIIGIVIAAITGLIIFGGVKKIANVAGRLVPIVTAFYIIICGYVILSNTSMIVPLFWDIIDGAFNFRTFGAGIIATLLIGMQKGIFSSEVGLGTGSIAAATADVKTGISGGLVHTFGIHIENIIFATLTIFAVAMSDYSNIIFYDPNRNRINLARFQISYRSVGTNIYYNYNYTICTSHHDCRLLLWGI